MKKIKNNKLLVITIVSIICFYISYFLSTLFIDSVGSFKFILLFIFSTIGACTGVGIVAVFFVSLILLIINMIRKKDVSWLIIPLIVSALFIVLNKIILLS